MWGRPQGGLVINSSRTESVEHSPQRDIKKGVIVLVRCRSLDMIVCMWVFPTKFFHSFLHSTILRKFFTSKANPFDETTFAVSASRTVGNAFICLGFLGCGASWCHVTISLNSLKKMMALLWNVIHVCCCRCLLQLSAPHLRNLNLSYPSLAPRVSASLVQLFADAILIFRCSQQSCHLVCVFSNCG